VRVGISCRIRAGRRLPSLGQYRFKSHRRSDKIARQKNIKGVIARLRPANLKRSRSSTGKKSFCFFFFRKRRILFSAQRQINGAFNRRDSAGLGWKTG